MGNGRMLFGRRSGLGRKNYECRGCGQTARAGLLEPDPKCPCGAGVMFRKDPPPKHRGAGKNKDRWPKRWRLQMEPPSEFE